MKTYRQLSLWPPLVGYVLLSAGIFAAYLYFTRETGDPRNPIIMTAGILVVSISAATLVAYLVRAWLVPVRIDPQSGIRIGTGRLLPWESLRKIERQRPRFRKASERIGPTMPPLKIDPVDVFLSRRSRGAEMGCFYAIPFLFLPVLEVWLPYGDRISIYSLEGSIVLRDLSHADDFLQEIHRECKSRQLRGVFSHDWRKEMS